MRSLLILGAGGMGRMMQETALQLGYEDIAFLDDAKKEKDVIGKCCDYEAFLQDYDAAIAAFGDNNMRLLWTERLMEAGYDSKSECNGRTRMFCFTESGSES